MKSYFTTAVGFGILSALQSFTAVNAQVQQNDLLKITVTGTRSEETVKDYAGSVDVITKDDLKYKPKSDLREVFDEIPGITTFSGARRGVRGLPGLNNINIRGMEGDRKSFLYQQIELLSRK